MEALQVPFTQQPKGSRQCLAACITMILRHHKKTADQNKIWKKLRTPSPSENYYIKVHAAADFLKNKGFGVSIIRPKSPLDAIERSLVGGHLIILNVREFPSSNSGHALLCIGMDKESLVVHNPMTKGYEKLPKSAYLELCEPLDGSPSEITPRIMVTVASTQFNPAFTKNISCGCGVIEHIGFMAALYGGAEQFISSTDVIICTGCDTHQDHNHLIGHYAAPAPV